MRIGATILLLGGAVLAGAGAWLYTPDLPRARLEAKYAASPAEFMAVAGLRLHVRDSGPRAAPALVLLHGFGASLLTWEPWAQALAGQYRVIRYDLPGFGLTGPDPTGDYSEARGVAVLAALLDRLGVARATLVGNSMGGNLAWRFAATHPARVARLVLISPDGFATRGFEYGRKPRVPWLLHLLPYVLPQRMLRQTLGPAYGDPAALTAARLAEYRDMLLAPGVRRAMLARIAQATRQPPEPLLRTIRAPTLLIWGERDRMIPFSNAADYLRAIPGSRLVAFADLGHVPQEEAPERALAPLLAFLAAAPSGR